MIIPPENYQNKHCLQNIYWNTKSFQRATPIWPIFNFHTFCVRCIINSAQQVPNTRPEPKYLPIPDPCPICFSKWSAISEIEYRRNPYFWHKLMCRLFEYCIRTLPRGGMYWPLPPFSVKTEVAPSVNRCCRPQNCSSESGIQQMALQFWKDPYGGSNQLSMEKRLWSSRSPRHLYL